MTSIPANQNTADNRRTMYRRTNALPVFQKHNANNILVANLVQNATESHNISP
jgi:hypothetical protein